MAESNDSYKAIVTIEFPTEWPDEDMAMEWAEAWIDHLKTDRRLREHGGELDYHIFIADGAGTVVGQ